MGIYVPIRELIQPAPHFWSNRARVANNVVLSPRTNALVVANTQQAVKPTLLFSGISQVQQYRYNNIAIRN